MAHQMNVVTASERSTALNCSRRWYWSYGLLLAPERKPVYWSFGSLWHLMMDTLYRHLQASPPLPFDATPWADVQQEVDEAITQWLDMEGVASSQVEVVKADEAEAWAKAQALADIAGPMFQGYCEAFLRTGGQDRDWHIIDVEGKGSAPLTAFRHPPGLLPARKSRTDRYAGRWDMVARRDDEYLLVEHKTTVMKAIAMESSLQLNPQAEGYVWLAKHTGLIPMDSPVTVIYSIVRKAAPKQPTLTAKGHVSRAACDTTPAKFIKALADAGQMWQGEASDLVDARIAGDGEHALIGAAPEAYHDRLEQIRLAQPGNWFHRVERYVSDADLLLFEREARWDARQIADMRRRAVPGRQGEFSRNWNACMAPGRSCPFLGLCRSGYAPEADPKWEQAGAMGFVRKAGIHTELAG